MENGIDGCSDFLKMFLDGEYLVMTERSQECILKFEDVTHEGHE